jgi:hypothetical protein
MLLRRDYQANPQPKVSIALPAFHLTPPEYPGSPSNGLCQAADKLVPMRKVNCHPIATRDPDPHSRRGTVPGQCCVQATETPVHI